MNIYLYISGTDHCAKCGTHLPTNVTKEEATTCFLTYGGLAGSGKPEDTVFECACKAEYNGTGSDGITCNGKLMIITRDIQLDPACQCRHYRNWITLAPGFYEYLYLLVITF